MCIGGAPSAPPTVPLKQAAKAPDAGSTDTSVNSTARRRLAYAATVLTSPTGTMGAPSTTAGSATLGG